MSVEPSQTVQQPIAPLDPNRDLESQRPGHGAPVRPSDEKTIQTDASPATSSAPADLDHVPEMDDELQDNSQVPRLGLWKLFWFFFYNFGLYAWGGPVAQIALIKQRLVVEDRWITLRRFQKVFAVYQILPGPEAAELCMFFGCLSAGRIGGIVAGLAFMLPGFVLMLLASYVYVQVGLTNEYVGASFRALQPVVAALVGKPDPCSSTIVKACHKIAEHTFLDHATKKTNPWLVGMAIMTAVNSALRINIFISLAVFGVINTFLVQKGRFRRVFLALAAVTFALIYVGYGLVVAYRGVPKPVSLALGIARTPSVVHLFVLGLVAGSLSFGGAYTAIPFVQVEAVLLGKWLPQNVFIDCIAIANVLPAPLVIFATFVGFVGGYRDGGYGQAFAGAVVITVGIFFPCFLFTIAGHSLLEKLIRNRYLTAFFDGLCGAVIGVIAVIAAEIMKAAVGGNPPESDSDPARIKRANQTGLAAVICVLALMVLYKFSHRLTVILLVIVAAIAGQYFFVEHKE
ncbi:MAG: glutamine-dependent NAD(+) synthetase [Watsoniomyces obsoletus]|nr:MAG: glutamine-dependent NAD(+) synthetase [Watsoniomyces obsoletus]